MTSSKNLDSIEKRSTGECDEHRRFTEPRDPLRTPYAVDRHRIISSTAFRRLEGKTQVFLAGRHDHFRTRLTHTLEVANIARCVAVVLGASAELAEAIALAHDLGHPPFGHAGEVALNEMMANDGGFNHNAHSVRVVEYLEHPFPAFRGLNLTMAVLDGLRAHATRYDIPAEALGQSPRDSTPLNPPLYRGDKGEPVCDAQNRCHVQVEDPLWRANRGHGVVPPSHYADQESDPPSVEAQIASLADRIAYNCHDLEDAIGAELITADDLSLVALWRRAYDKAVSAWGHQNIHAIRRLVLDTMLDGILADVASAAAPRKPTADPSRQGTGSVQFAHPESRAQVHVGLSTCGDGELVELEQFLLNRVYRHSEVAAADAQGQSIVRGLFEAYRRQPAALPDRFRARVEDQGLDRVITDYIAGMTDRFCRQEHERLCRNA